MASETTADRRSRASCGSSKVTSLSNQDNSDPRLRSKARMAGLGSDEEQVVTEGVDRRVPDGQYVALSKIKNNI